MNHNLDRVVRLFYLKQQLCIRFRFCTTLFGVYYYNLASICTITESIRFNVFLNPFRMSSIFADDQYKRLHNRSAVIFSIYLQFLADSLMTENTILQHELINLLITKVIKIYIRTGNCKRSPCIAIRNCP